MRPLRSRKDTSRERLPCGVRRFEPEPRVPIGRSIRVWTKLRRIQVRNEPMTPLMPHKLQAGAFRIKPCGVGSDSQPDQITFLSGAGIHHGGMGGNIGSFQIFILSLQAVTFPAAYCEIRHAASTASYQPKAKSLICRGFYLCPLGFTARGARKRAQTCAIWPLAAITHSPDTVANVEQLNRLCGERGSVGLDRIPAQIIRATVRIATSLVIRTCSAA